MREAAGAAADISRNLVGCMADRTAAYSRMHHLHGLSRSPFMGLSGHLCSRAGAAQSGYTSWCCLLLQTKQYRPKYAFDEVYDEPAYNKEQVRQAGPIECQGKGAGDVGAATWPGPLWVAWAWGGGAVGAWCMQVPCSWSVRAASGVASYWPLTLCSQGY